MESKLKLECINVYKNAKEKLSLGFGSQTSKLTLLELIFQQLVQSTPPHHS